MATSSTAVPPISGTLPGTEISSPPPPPQTTQIIPGTTVVGTGTTGDVWSYTIPDATSVFPLTASAPATAAPNPPANTLIFTTVVVSGTTVTGGMETGVPWSYTIPAATFLSSVIVPITLAPTQSSVLSETSTPTSAPISDSQTLSPSTSDSVTPSAAETLSSLSPSSPSSFVPSPSAASSQKDTSALSGGIVAVVLGALLLIILGVAMFLCLRVRRRRRHLGPDWDKHGEKDVGVVWGKGWAREDKGRRGWRKGRPGMTRGEGSGDSSGVGSRTRLNPSGEMSETREVDERPRPGVRPRIKYPYPAPTPDLPASHSSSYTQPTSYDNRYPSSLQYPQGQPDPNPRTTLGPKPPRSIPPPSPHVYAPPPTPPRPPSPQPAPVPDLYCSASPPLLYQSSFMTRSTSPHGSNTTSPVPRAGPGPGPGPNRLSKQRVTPSASALLRHMVPTRGASLRRPRPGPVQLPSSSSESEQPTRPGMATLPSFIRERQFSPSRSGGGVVSSSQSALFSPRTSHSPLPLPHSRSYATSRDGLLSPPPTFPRDRYSQMTTTTRSGDSRYARRSMDSRVTGRSGDSRMTGRSADSRMTGRSADSRLTSRSGGLDQIVEERAR
ncbi:hypothetical protein FRC08_001223 [Ceratobasidium sp. 394]|nr:hypothetical protein FRC08_001223 [Ceratobasidium sp. 394]